MALRDGHRRPVGDLHVDGHHEVVVEVEVAVLAEVHRLGADRARGDDGHTGIGESRAELVREVVDVRRPLPRHAGRGGCVVGGGRRRVARGGIGPFGVGIRRGAPDERERADEEHEREGRGGAVHGVSSVVVDA
jgi:hypothetical protein